MLFSKPSTGRVLDPILLLEALCRPLTPKVCFVQSLLAGCCLSLDILAPDSFRGTKFNSQQASKTHPSIDLLTNGIDRCTGPGSLYRSKVRQHLNSAGIKLFYMRIFSRFSQNLCVGLDPGGLLSLVTQDSVCTFPTLSPHLLPMECFSGNNKQLQGMLRLHACGHRHLRMTFACCLPP